MKLFVKQAMFCVLLPFWPSTATAQEADAVFPITIEHAFGETIIKERPVRVATVSWANHEVPLALGVVPVGFAAANFGDDDGDGLLPWVDARLDELQAEPPTLFDEGDGIDFEAVAATEPDVILAAHSGLSRSDYDTLSMIAPVVAYPDAPWTTDWRSMIRLNAAGMGMEAEGQALIERLDGEITATAARYPELRGKTAMFITHLDATDLSVVRFYSANDTRVQFFEDLGLSMPSSVREATRPGQYSGEVSAELVDRFDDVDIFVSYGTQDLLNGLTSDPLLARMPAIANGALVMLGNDPVGTGASPTPLSISWVLDDYVAMLAKAARAAE
ncbi:iron-siderophore ABC transporter substrate-binding protein [Paracoccus sp. TK19116]|uniref:Iron-siderophore ABC transporter substrate-binding protein n=1 Tax=Paracoccus albicereus TaxID=2922394 RepID=A0ABT1MPI0_9RHOB|nr:iron-siderophore ABC transporter substrate-binding protein [Paracoccus albicereus]MCQ0970197.1 iron-siderophore ABC transporter substrate-binding protein [Paracoccus albicereus]